MTAITLFDTFTVDGVRRTEDGYVAAFARVARTGIQEYKGYELGRPELDVVRVYRPPEEVFHADALKSFAHRPLTLKHPPVPVTAKNWKKYSRGQTGGEVVRDGEFVRVPMVMMDQALIDAYERDGIKQLSMGYSTDIKWRTGVTDAGEKYDAVQTAIRGNHLAIVPDARGGDKLAIGDGKRKKPLAFDAETAFRELIARIQDKDEDDDTQGEDPEMNDADLTACPKCGEDIPSNSSDCPECGHHIVKDGANTMAKIVIDGVPVNVADEQGAAIIDRHLTRLEQQLKDGNANFEKMKKEKDDKDKDVDDAKKVISAKDGEIVVLKKQVADAAITPEKLDVMVKDRLAVIDSASMLLDKTFTFDGKTIEAIRRAAVEANLGDAAKGMDDATIGGAFAALTVDAAKNTRGGSQPIRQALYNNGRQPLGDARQVAYDEKVKRQESAWKKPATA